jgi:hypothetical protein
MPKSRTRDLSGLALVMAIPLIPGLACLTAPLPSAPVCVEIRCSAVAASQRSSRSLAITWPSDSGWVAGSDHRYRPSATEKGF